MPWLLLAAGMRAMSRARSLVGDRKYWHHKNTKTGSKQQNVCLAKGDYMSSSHYWYLTARFSVFYNNIISNLGAILAMKVIYAMEEVNNSANEDRYNWRPKQRTIKQIISWNSSSVHCCLRYFNSLVTSRWVHTAIIFCPLQLLLLRLYYIWLNFHKMSQDRQLSPIPNIFIPRTPKYYILLHSQEKGTKAVIGVVAFLKILNYTI